MSSSIEVINSNLNDGLALSPYSIPISPVLGIDESKLDGVVISDTINDGSVTSDIIIDADMSQSQTSRKRR